MKKFMKFAAMAAAALFLCAACEEKGGADDKTPLTIDGKQFSFNFLYAGQMQLDAVLDLGVNVENTAMVLVDMGAMMGSETSMWSPFLGGGNYTVTSVDETSGSISMVDPADPSGAELVINYSNLTEDSVTLSCEAEALTLDNVTATLVTDKITITPME